MKIDFFIELRIDFSLRITGCFQRSDWRVRPLPAEMEQYARTDAHYLLYIAQRMRSDLIQSCNTQSSLSMNYFDSDMCEVLSIHFLLCIVKLFLS